MAQAQNQWVPSPLPSSQTAQGTTNKEGVIFPSAARTATTYDSDPMLNTSARGVRIYCDITADNGGSVIVVLQTKDPVSGQWVSVGNGSSATWATAAQTRSLTLYPGLLTANGTATTDTVGNGVLGTLWRVHLIVGTATVTFSVGAEYLL